MQVEVGFFKFSKDLVSVNNDLSLKLPNFDIGGRPLKWVGEVLIDRTFYARVEGASSNRRVGTGEVSHGSVFWSPLFCLLANDWIVALHSPSFYLLD